MPVQGDRSVRRLLLGSHEDVTYWYLDAPPDRLLKRAGRGYYEQMTTTVSARWVMNFDQELLRRIGAGWVLPLVARMAGGEDVDLDAALEARAAAGGTDPPEIDRIEWSVG